MPRPLTDTDGDRGGGTPRSVVASVASDGEFGVLGHERLGRTVVITEHSIDLALATLLAFSHALPFATALRISHYIMV